MLVVTFTPKPVEGKFSTRSRTNSRIRSRAHTRAAIHMATLRSRSSHTNSKKTPESRLVNNEMCFNPEFKSLEPDMCYGMKMSKIDLRNAYDISCGLWDTIEDIANACQNDSDCDAFTTLNEKPWCLKTIKYHTREITQQDHNLYYVRKTVTEYNQMLAKQNHGGSSFFGLIILLFVIFCTTTS